MDLNLAEKVVIVTGGGSNIGRGIVLAFVKEGANVVIAEIDEAQGGKTAKDANALSGGKAIAIKTDITNVDSVTAMVKKTLEEFGKVDVLVNNAAWVMDRLFVEKPRAEWEREINIILWGNINCTRAVLDHMIERKYGKIVNIGSDAGRMGEFREAVYSGAKGGVIALSKSLARELGRHGINVNVVCPSLIVPESKEYVSKESMWGEELMAVFTPEAQEKAAKAYPLRRLGKPEDIANATLFLASDAASWITGQTLSVDGGYVMM
ncbi:MAG TPA: 3-oxoacyl-ACP reductase FabG [Dehalococcoidia bacterium]|nr:3-oxoacyl-ACP reductase FabG [Dehalococcoidia bacterium]